MEKHGLFHKIILPSLISPNNRQDTFKPHFRDNTHCFLALRDY